MQPPGSLGPVQGRPGDLVSLGTRRVPRRAALSAQVPFRYMSTKTLTKDTDVSGTKPEEQTAAQEATAPASREKRKPLMKYNVDDCHAAIWSRDVVIQGASRT